MAINLAEKYSSNVEERFHMESITQSSFSKKRDVEFTGVKTVKVYEVNTVEMNDYVRSGNNRYGTPEELEDNIREYIMTKDRAFTFTIDKGNNMEQNMIKKAGETTDRQVREVVTPEIDKYRFEKWAAGAGTIETPASPTAENVYGILVNAKVAMDNKKVPKKNRTLYVGSEYYKALLNCKQFIELEKLGSKTVANGQIGQILGMVVKDVPDDLLPEGVGFMIILKDSAFSPVKLHELNVHKDPPGISGHLCEGRFIYDAFVNETKKDGIYVGKLA